MPLFINGILLKANRKLWMNVVTMTLFRLYDWK
jgi:hypothetical protein